ncbi:hypothetical protein P354_26825 [Streptomyces noursei PD-1]|nr:hypothetical protein P354_26825 [Streptomyces noursei PD-1]
MPRWPSSPYMIVMVSTKTLSAREPDHRAMAKPSEMTSGRWPVKTSFSSGRATSSTPRLDSTVPAACRRWERKFSSVVWPIQGSV